VVVIVVHQKLDGFAGDFAASPCLKQKSRGVRMQSGPFRHYLPDLISSHQT
jgi:hypothetical protein